VEVVKTCWSFPPSTSTQCTSRRINSVELVQYRDDIECPLTLQNKPGIIGDQRKQLIYRA
jgi:hypothetical protein